MPNFEYHKPSAEGVKRIQAIRQAAARFEAVLDANAPSSRELSVAKTNLETTVMWATKSVVVNDPESVVDPDG